MRIVIHDANMQPIACTDINIKDADFTYYNGNNTARIPIFTASPNYTFNSGISANATMDTVSVMLLHRVTIYRPDKNNMTGYIYWTLDTDLVKYLRPVLLDNQTEQNGIFKC